MNTSPRRVIIGSGSDGRSTVTRDSAADVNYDVGLGYMHQLWLTRATPPDLSVDELAAAASNGLIQQPAAGGTLFQVCTFNPHTESPLHKTDTIDYVVVTTGTIDMDTEDGATVSLRTGDCLVQLATVHRWVNRSDEPATLAVTCISTGTNLDADLGIQVV